MNEFMEQEPLGERVSHSFCVSVRSGSRNSRAPAFQKDGGVQFAELQQLLTEKGEPELAAQAPGLMIFDRCRCGDDCCAKRGRIKAWGI